ncbi:hypothetical protein BGZ60DRAFT_11359 [Tricladium varicosporioides]|nr:hypothetical protein BGZ60DRAFT_11359 [Hymenoscyphus varicosporioides]
MIVPPVLHRNELQWSKASVRVLKQVRFQNNSFYEGKTLLGLFRLSPQFTDVCQARPSTHLLCKPWRRGANATLGVQLKSSSSLVSDCSGCSSSAPPRYRRTTSLSSSLVFFHTVSMLHNAFLITKYCQRGEENPPAHPLQKAPSGELKSPSCAIARRFFAHLGGPEPD